MYYDRLDKFRVFDNQTGEYIDDCLLSNKGDFIIIESTSYINDDRFDIEWLIYANGLIQVYEGDVINAFGGECYCGVWEFKLTDHKVVRYSEFDLDMALGTGYELVELVGNSRDL